jgi:deoxyribodipyrimidine photolyase-related protein
MEAFYRKMRKQFNLLMVDGAPEGERWNFDQENRKKLNKTDISKVPKPKIFTQATSAVIQRLDRHKVEYFGNIDEYLVWPTSQQDSLELLEHFCTHCLPLFGRFQDAMTGESEYGWSLYHSRLSFSLNAKLISPMQVVDRAIQEFKNRPQQIELAQIEGFVRQIVGWREFMRGMYWANMPNYASLNKLEHSKQLPDFYWTGETRMRCVAHSVKQSLEYAYAHHIQRLMVTGTFSLLIGVHPDAVDEWYLGVYIDAIEWVEMPNTRGMSQYADGGLIGSKPYIASGSYINKMSDYCGKCHYNVKLRTGDKSCPFNSLYWQFLIRHRDTLGNNSRLALPYRNLDRMEPSTVAALTEQAEHYLDNIDTL